MKVMTGMEGSVESLVDKVEEGIVEEGIAELGIVEAGMGEKEDIEMMADMVEGMETCCRAEPA